MMQTDVSAQIPQVNFHDFFLACARTSHLLDGLLHLAKEKGKVQQDEVRQNEILIIARKTKYSKSACSKRE